MAKFYVINAIPYVNAAPHIGHALEFVQADTVARYRKIIDDDVFFSFGSDENSLKNVQAAEKEKVTVRQLVDKYAKRFDALKGPLNLSYDVFNRTATPSHFKGAQKFWLSCKKEDIYKKMYSGLYCVGCEEFWAKDDLIDGKCPDHKIVPENVEEENYFFRLSKYQNILEKLITSDKLLIIPQTRKNEVLSFIKQGLRDFSISRSVDRAKGWGVPVPNDPSQIQYVWFDALITYLTALGYGSDNESLFKKYWLENGNKVHFIGKGIVRFHAIYWPAMLLSAGIPLPNIEFVHGYVTVNGEKISKSLGNVIDPFVIAKEYGTDSVRYYLLREIPAYGDGDFSESRFKEVYNADLANGLGNLVSRIAKLCKDAGYTQMGSEERVSGHILHTDEYTEALSEFRFNDALTVVWEKIKRLDQFIDQEKPWELVKNQNRKIKDVLAHAVDQLQEIAAFLEPFLPETAKKIEDQFKGPKIVFQNPLFPRLT